VTDEHRKFMFESALPMIVHELLDRSYPENKETPKYVNEFFKYVISIALKYMQRNPGKTPPRLVRLIGAVMSESKKFFARYGQPESKTKKQSFSQTDDEETWRDHLKIGDELYVRINSKVLQSTIVEMSPTETEAKLRVQSTGETTWLSTDSPLLSLFLNTDEEEDTKKSQQQEEEKNLPKWRQELKVGSLVDAQDQVRVWYRGRVEDVSKDRLLIQFLGWSTRFNDWIPRSSSRLAEIDTKSYGHLGRDAYKNMTNADRAWAEPLPRIDDTLDGDKKVYGVKRAGRTTSSLLLENLRFFGENRGFSVLLQRLESKSLPPPSLDMLDAVVSVAEKFVYILSRRLAGRFCVKFVNNVLNILLRLDKQTLRGFRPEMLQKMIRRLRPLMSRVKTVSEVSKKFEIFRLAMIQKLLKLPMITQRRYALVMLCHCIDLAEKAEMYPKGERIEFSTMSSSDVTKSSVTSTLRIVPIARYLSCGLLVKWITNNDIVTPLFEGDLAHEQLMKQSERVFAFLAIRKVLSVNVVKMVWRAAQNAQDANTHEIVLTLLHNITYVLSTAHRKSLMRSICDVSVKNMSKEVMMLTQNLVLVSASDMNNKEKSSDDASSNSSTIRRGVNCLWSIMQDGSGAIRDIASLALTSLSSLLCRPELEFQREIYLEKCIQHISESKSVCL